MSTTYSVPTLPIGMDHWITNGVMTSVEALTFIEQLSPEVPYSIMKTTTQYQADPVVVELSRFDLFADYEEEQQVYCAVCGTHYHPEDPCILH